LTKAIEIKTIIPIRILLLNNTQLQKGAGQYLQQLIW